MTTGNRWLALGLVALMATAPAAAQTNNRIDRLATQLELTDQQLATIKAGLEETEEASSIWALSASLQRTLTADQKEKLFQQGQVRRAFGEGLQQGRRQAMAANQRSGQSRAARWGADNNRRSGRGITNTRQRANRERRPVIDRMVDSLTDEQKAELETLRESNQTRVQELRTAAESGEIDRTEARKQMLELRKSMREQADNVLTDDQKARMAELRERRQPRARTQARRTRAATRGARVEGRAGVRGQAGSPGVRGQAGAPGVRGQAGTPGVRGQASTPAVRAFNAEAMINALGLSEAQAETIRIHAALTAGIVASRGAGRSQRVRSRTPRSR